MAKAAKPKKPPHRPPFAWTEEIEDEIFRRIGEGQAIRNICADDSLPAWDTVRKRLIDDADFAARYGRAREAQADTLFDQILEIADTPLIGTKTKTTANGVEVTEGDMIEHRRLQVDARKWMAGKLRPKVYGERQAVEHSGPDGGAIPVSGIALRIVRPDERGDT